MRWIAGHVWLASFMCLFLLFFSCRSVEYVPVETVKTEIEYRDRIMLDSIHVRDSIIVRDKGDTVFVNKWHTAYRDRLIRDTAFVYRTDSVQIPYPVERPLSRWQRAKLELGGWAFGGIILFAMVIVGWLVKKKLR